MKSTGGESVAETGCPEELTGSQNPAIHEVVDRSKAAFNGILMENDLGHPRAEAFFDWLEKDQENLLWYIRNQEDLKLVEDGIEILGDVFCLEDETAEANGLNVWNYEGTSYFAFIKARIHAEAQNRIVPKDWSKYLDFLPGTDANKYSFLTDVLGLKLTGSYSSEQGDVLAKGLIARYWSSSLYKAHAEYLFFYANYIDPCAFGSINEGCSLRCLKSVNDDWRIIIE